MNRRPRVGPRRLPTVALVACALVMAPPLAGCVMTDFNGHATTTGELAEHDEPLDPVPQRCPTSRATVLCDSLRTWARHPAGGPCCAFRSSCEIPIGWRRHAGPDCAERK